MKYIYSHPKTKELLEYRAGETPLTIASFFFSYLGTEIQKSQEGLSRALLFKILSSERPLIPELLPNMWADAYGSDEEITVPSSAELRQAFEKMGQSQSQIRKFCIFIDGLDEYSGKPLDGVNFILDLAKNCNMKIVISSRPIQPCAQAFSRIRSFTCRTLQLAILGPILSKQLILILIWAYFIVRIHARPTI